MRRNTIRILAAVALAAIPAAASAQSPRPDPVAVVSQAIDGFVAAPSFRVHGEFVSVPEPGMADLIGGDYHNNIVVATSHERS